MTPRTSARARATGEDGAPSITLPAPAKLNLFLHILGRREDGYHTLQTAFDFVDCCDSVQLTLCEDGTIQRQGRITGLAQGQSDLCERAAVALRHSTGTSLGARISLSKHIPVGAGMGGGSSDAATVLHGLNHLWGCGLSHQALADIGLSLGADVPVFVHGFSAFAEGVGEQLVPISLPPRWYLVVLPDCRISTAEIFADSGLTRDTRAITIADFYAGGQRNDCEPVVVEHCPQVAATLAWLRSKANGRMTGTGSAVFAAFSSQAEAQVLSTQLPEGWNSMLCQGLDRSPLHSQLMRDEVPK